MTDRIDTAKERERLKCNDAVLHRIPSYLDALDGERAENERLREALLFYADSGKYPAPLTGGQGDLYFDCGQIARAALNPEGGE